MLMLTRLGDFGKCLRFGAPLAALVLGLGCDQLVDVELPHLLTDESIESPESVQTQLNSAIALFECGYSAFGFHATGHEDVLEPTAGPAASALSYRLDAATGDCDGSSVSHAWIDPIVGARALLSTSPARLVPGAGGTGRGLYDRIQDEWSLGEEGERVSAIAAIYVAASLGHIGEFVCEGAIDGSDLLTPADLLTVAEDWITNRALVHIGSVGDFPVPYGVATSAESMAMALRARIRWANGNLAGAAADAAAVPDGFTAWVTRENAETRRNKIFHGATEVGFGAMLGVNVWWNGAIRRPNPATGTQWPDPLPHTGYLFLGIMPDGRTLEAGNIPVRWAEEFRALGDAPTPLSNGAVPDTRVLHFKKQIQGSVIAEVPDRYSGNDARIPYLSWEEMRLIEADYEWSLGNFQNAIDLVNILRADKNLWEVSGAYLTTLTDGASDADEVRHLLLEERRREFFAEGGRYWSTKIQNTDVLWFPRREGTTVGAYGANLDGGVRVTFGEDEYLLNPYFIDRGGLDARATGCTALPGSQAPVLS